MTNLGLMQLAIESMLKQKDDVAKELLEVHYCAALSDVNAKCMCVVHPTRESTL